MAKATHLERGKIPPLTKAAIAAGLAIALAVFLGYLIELARHRELVRNISRHPSAELWWPEFLAWVEESPESRAVWFGPIVRDVWANPDTPEEAIYAFEMEHGQCLAGHPSKRDRDRGDRTYLDMPGSGAPPLAPLPSVDEHWAIAVERDENELNVVVSGVRIIVPE